METSSISAELADVSFQIETVAGEVRKLRQAVAVIGLLMVEQGSGPLGKEVQLSYTAALDSMRK